MFLIGSVTGGTSASPPRAAEPPPTQSRQTAHGGSSTDMRTGSYVLKTANETAGRQSNGSTDTGTTGSPGSLRNGGRPGSSAISSGDAVALQAQAFSDSSVGTSANVGIGQAVQINDIIGQRARLDRILNELAHIGAKLSGQATPGMNAAAQRTELAAANASTRLNMRL